MFFFCSLLIPQQPAILLGQGDLSDQSYLFLKKEIFFDEILYGNTRSDWPAGFCSYKFILVPTSQYMEDKESNVPFVYSILVASIFFFMLVIFLIYDVEVERRNKKMVSTAVRSGAIVSSVFPKAVQERLFKDAAANETQNQNNKSLPLKQTKTHLRSYLVENSKPGPAEMDDTEWLLTSKPIADLFTETTIMFADILWICRLEFGP